MIKSLQATQEHFESSSSRTPEYLAWHRLFKREFKKYLTEKFNAVNIEIGKPNHFDISGFFTVNNQIWWFRIEDIRWSKDNMLIRTAQHYKDYTGGINRFVSLNQDIIDFDRQFRNVVAN